ncbi:hypothetical protein BDB00DRAFT_842340 [Zychaea mexicana]|uniref:uncharacterized protein n=1 Tax=Zychaea mexicana TaxID=64656 RepID=UPI0022FE7D77|nr:uncharacterized protein BDB00DRAFT_842340 [Zychaea mexicana]KAI9489630.1 hypothetical protein BDB00DRAFT_842340 [Zychaea mexicana]
MTKYGVLPSIVLSNDAIMVSLFVTPSKEFDKPEVRKLCCLDINTLNSFLPGFRSNHLPTVNQCYQQTWSCASSDTDSPDLSSYASPSFTPASSPPSTPTAIVPPLELHQHHRPSSSSSSSTTTSPSAVPHQQQQHPRSGPQTRTPWTQHEDNLLRRGYDQGLSWAMISSTYLPHRSRGCCWGRFKTLQAKALERRDWDDTEDQLLLIAMKKHARLFKLAWKAVSQDMPNRSWRECESRSFKVASANVIRKRQLFTTPANVIS